MPQDGGGKQLALLLAGGAVFGSILYARATRKSAAHAGGGAIEGAAVASAVPHHIEPDVLLGLARAIIAAPDLRSAIDRLVNATLGLLLAERCTLFLLDDTEHPGHLYVALTRGASASAPPHDVTGSLHKVRIPVDRGSIAGTCAATGECINVPAAYQDARFDRRVDEQTGFITRSILAIPLKDEGGAVVAVLEAINKRECEDDVASLQLQFASPPTPVGARNVLTQLASPPPPPSLPAISQVLALSPLSPAPPPLSPGTYFSEDDAASLSTLASFAGTVLHRMTLNAAVERERDRGRQLTQLMQRVSSASNTMRLSEVVDAVLGASYRLLQAQRVTVLLLDLSRRYLHIVSSRDASGVRIPLSSGLAGWCATHGAPVVVSNAYADPRFDPSVDAATGFRTLSVVCVPIRDSGGEVVGVLQAINRLCCGSTPLWREFSDLEGLVDPPPAAAAAGAGAGEEPSSASMAQRDDAGRPPTEAAGTAATAAAAAAALGAAAGVQSGDTAAPVSNATRNLGAGHLPRAPWVQDDGTLPPVVRRASGVVDLDLLPTVQESQEPGSAGSGASGGSGHNGSWRQVQAAPSVSTPQPPPPSTSTPHAPHPAPLFTPGACPPAPRSGAPEVWPFTPFDLDVLETMAAHAAVAMRSAQLLEEMSWARRTAAALLDVVQVSASAGEERPPAFSPPVFYEEGAAAAGSAPEHSSTLFIADENPLHSPSHHHPRPAALGHPTGSGSGVLQRSGMQSLIHAIVAAAYTLLDCERVTLYLVDSQKQELWMVLAQDSGAQGTRIPIGRGLAGHVAATGIPLNIPDAYLDARFNPALDAETGFCTRSVLVWPISLTGVASGAEGGGHHPLPLEGSSRHPALSRGRSIGALGSAGEGVADPSASPPSGVIAVLQAINKRAPSLAGIATSHGGAGPWPSQEPLIRTHQWPLHHPSLHHPSSSQEAAAGAGNVASGADGLITGGPDTSDHANNAVAAAAAAAAAPPPSGESRHPHNVALHPHDHASAPNDDAGAFTGFMRFSRADEKAMAVFCAEVAVALKRRSVEAALLKVLSDASTGSGGAEAVVSAGSAGTAGPALDMDEVSVSLLSMFTDAGTGARMQTSVRVRRGSAASVAKAPGAGTGSGGVRDDRGGPGTRVASPAGGPGAASIPAAAGAVADATAAFESSVTAEAAVSRGSSSDSTTHDRGSGSRLSSEGAAAGDTTPPPLQPMLQSGAAVAGGTRGRGLRELFGALRAGKGALRAQPPTPVSTSCEEAPSAHVTLQSSSLFAALPAPAAPSPSPSHPPSDTHRTHAPSNDTSPESAGTGTTGLSSPDSTPRARDSSVKNAAPASLGGADATASTAAPTVIGDPDLVTWTWDVFRLPLLGAEASLPDPFGAPAPAAAPVLLAPHARSTPPPLDATAASASSPSSPATASGAATPPQSPITGSPSRLFADRVSRGEMRLAHAVESMFSHFDLLEAFSIPRHTFLAFIRSVRALYHPHPFHNYFHAVSVLHATFLLIRTTPARDILTPLDVFGALLAAYGHDIDHPGHSNMFEVASMSPLALEHNDDAVLERHHAHTLFRVMLDPRHNVLAGLPPTSARSLRVTVLKAVLATDMSRHFATVAELGERSARLGERERERRPASFSGQAFFSASTAVAGGGGGVLERRGSARLTRRSRLSSVGSGLSGTTVLTRRSDGAGSARASSSSFSLPLGTGSAALLSALDTPAAAAAARSPPMTRHITGGSASSPALTASSLSSSSMVSAGSVPPAPVGGAPATPAAVFLLPPGGAGAGAGTAGLTIGEAGKDETDRVPGGGERGGMGALSGRAADLRRRDSRSASDIAPPSSARHHQHTITSMTSSSSSSSAASSREAGAPTLTERSGSNVTRGAGPLSVAAGLVPRQLSSEEEGEVGEIVFEEEDEGGGEEEDSDGEPELLLGHAGAGGWPSGGRTSSATSRSDANSSSASLSASRYLLAQQQHQQLQEREQGLLVDPSGVPVAGSTSSSVPSSVSPRSSLLLSPKGKGGDPGISVGGSHIDPVAAAAAAAIGVEEEEANRRPAAVAVSVGPAGGENNNKAGGRIPFGLLHRGIGPTGEDAGAVTRRAPTARDTTTAHSTYRSEPTTREDIRSFVSPTNGSAHPDGGGSSAAGPLSTSPRSMGAGMVFFSPQDPKVGASHEVDVAVRGAAVGSGPLPAAAVQPLADAVVPPIIRWKGAGSVGEAGAAAERTPGDSTDGIHQAPMQATVTAPSTVGVAGDLPPGVCSPPLPQGPQPPTRFALIKPSQDRGDKLGDNSGSRGSRSGEVAGDATASEAPLAVQLFLDTDGAAAAATSAREGAAAVVAEPVVPHVPITVPAPAAAAAVTLALATAGLPSPRGQAPSQHPAPRPQLPFDPSSDTERNELVATLVHTADLSGQAYGGAAARNWSRRILSEFHNEAALCRERGLPVPPFMAALDTPTACARVQLSFVSNVVLPLWSRLSELFPGGLDDPLANLNDIRVQYEAEMGLLEAAHGHGDGSAHGAAVGGSGGGTGPPSTVARE